MGKTVVKAAILNLPGITVGVRAGAFLRKLVLSRPRA